MRDLAQNFALVPLKYFTGCTRPSRLGKPTSLLHVYDFSRKLKLLDLS